MVKGLGSPLSTREWLFVILIVVGLQFFLHSISERYGSSASALGYVSFAGTIVSILLGLIAIIYSFVQSISQTSSVVEIRRQVDTLIAAAESIVDSRDKIKESAEEIGRVSSDLSERIEENTAHIRSTNEGLNKILTGGNIKDKGGKERRKTVFGAQKEKVVVMCHIVGLAVKSEWSVDYVTSNVIIPWGKAIGANSDIMSGLFIGVLMSMEAEGFVEVGAAATKISVPEGVNSLEEFEAVSKLLPRADSKHTAALNEIIENLTKS